MLILQARTTLEYMVEYSRTNGYLSKPGSPASRSAETRLQVTIGLSQLE